MLPSKYAGAIALILIVILVSTESKGGRGGRGGGFRSSSSRRSGGGGWFSWGSSRRSSSVVTSKPAPSSYYRNTPRQQAAAVVTPKPFPNKKPNPDYDWKAKRPLSSDAPTTPRSYYHHNSNNHYVGSTWSGRNGYQNRRNDSRDEYRPPYSNSYYQPGSNSNKKALLAGLGGSALGMYLGYQLGNMHQPSYSNHYVPSNNFQPQYSVVHHYHHGSRTFAKDEKINSTIIGKCNNITFCTPNTQPLCLTNGTIYCLAPISTLQKCNENSTQLLCVNTTLKVPCLNATDSSCNTTSPIKNITAQIPCLTSLHIFGDLTSGKLEIHRSFGQVTIDRNLTESVESRSPEVSIGHLTSQGISNEFCVTVIADPIVVEPELTNIEFVRRLQRNMEEMDKIKARLQKMLDDLLRV